MNILLDTHTFLWWSLEPEKLPVMVLNMMKSPKNRIIFSVVSSWEAQIKIGLGKLTLTEPLKKIVERELLQNNWEILPVTLHHTWKLSDLPPLHKDPFDRLLIAQSLFEDLTIATCDRLINIYPGIKTVWS